jgi:acyl dehydratase
MNLQGYGPMRYFEDFAAGQSFELGSHTVTRDEIVAFAHQFDPQPFHVDEQRARESPFGGLIASGWHSAAIFMRCYVDGLLLDSASLGSPGVEELRWLLPVRPGDTLRARGTVLAAQPSGRNPHRGTVTLAAELRNQDDQVVLSMTARGLFGRRPGG